MQRPPDRQEISEALHDREAQSEAAAALVRGVAELMILLEDRKQFFAGNTDAGIQDLNAEQTRTSAAAEQNLAVQCGFQSV